MDPFKLLRGEKVIITLIILGVITVVIGFIGFLWNDYVINLSSTIKSDKVGQLGDFIGGLAGSFWALAGVLLFYKALYEQRQDFQNNKESLNLQIEALNQQVEEFKLNRNELRSSRLVYENQNKTLKFQQFDSNFYSLLNVLQNVKNSITLKAADYFKDIVSKIGQVQDESLVFFDQHSKNIEKYLSIYNSEREKLSSYFRVVYRILKVIDETNDFTLQEKYFYSKIFRAQTSDYELILLFYNSYTPLGYCLRRFILKYNLLKHLPTLKKSEYGGMVQDQNESVLVLFFTEMEKFLILHFEKFYDLEFSKNKIEEYFESIPIVVGIYFSSEKLSIKITLEKISLNDIGFTLSDDTFLRLFHSFVFDKVVLCTYTDHSSVKLEPIKMEHPDKLVFCVELETTLNHQLNKDRY